MIKKLTIDKENSEFLKKIEELSGQTLTLCDQCGTCTGSCPMVYEMDITPSSIMYKVKLGDKSVLESEAIWICASCYNCMARCPRDLDLSKVAEALRQQTLRTAIDHIKLDELSKEELEELPPIALVAGFRKFTG